MKTPTFNEQAGKIIQAYHRNEISPYNACGCFVGNLLNNNGDWVYGRELLGEVAENYKDVRVAVMCIAKEASGFYTLEEIVEIEAVFMTHLLQERDEDSDETKEEILYNAMEAALEHLKRIHELKGEIVPDYTFTKRAVTA